MKTEEEYRLWEYQDLGPVGSKEHVRLKRHRIYGQICVEKRIPAELADIYRFMQTCSIPYIPGIYECITDQDTLIVIEEYIVGRNLEEMLCEKLFGEEEAVRILVELCEALKWFHHADPPIICRDIKAENVMIDQNGRVRIVDFNIARIYRKGMQRDTRLLGTVEYAAPEQYGYSQTDNRTDIYALGVLLNYLVTREFPFRQTVKGKLGQVVQTCISMDPKDRYQSVEELEEALGRLYPRQIAPEEATEDGVVGRTEEQTSALQKILPPGFRSRTPWKMAVAALGYFLITWCCFSMTLERDGVPLAKAVLLFEQSMLWVSQLAFVAVVWNYRGCRKYLPFLNQNSRLLRMVLYFLTYFAFVAVAASLCAMAELIFQV